ncbi:unnamed protein product [Arabidopsis lyrata]|uniref:Uncharacterized protein n=1 Tax=Arabidopsis lyrata subsp. lyrata TaxID=81972 RepID=D7L7N1_ARALL|nr:hypothetical protein ARALYDRAFT_899986 [Arabidopsis lyrata subsp. lyrata]CAH8262704.1 unnamed protein product [Arabidopsis lyrata]
MNNILRFLFVMVLCVGLGNAKIWGKNLVQFKNSVEGKQVNIFCKLNNKQLFVVFLEPGEIYDHWFHGQFVTTNKMDCDIRELQYKLVRIRAFQGASGSFDHGKTNYWDIREDGIYFTHGKDIPKLEYKW